LDVLGQLNTEDRHATGNYALKDILLALKWVNRNIESFGGDKDNVILMGYSVGGLVAQSFILSEHARGLFAKAVSMGGSLFTTFTFQPNPREKAEALGRALGLQWTDTGDLVAQMREISAERLLNVTFSFLPTEMPSELSQRDGFLPVTLVLSLQPSLCPALSSPPLTPKTAMR
jgi:carboxylesterase type B